MKPTDKWHYLLDHEIDNIYIAFNELLRNTSQSNKPPTAAKNLNLRCQKVGPHKSD